MKKILFIGNSHTFFENLPWVFSDISKQADIEVHAVMTTYPGCDLKWHLESPNTMQNLLYGGYNYAVIQQAAHPFGGAESLIEYGSTLIDIIKSVGAIPVIYCPWSEKNNPEGQQLISQAHVKLHELNEGTLLAMCGSAWYSLRDVVDLYFTDGEHQNSQGAYLNACVLAKTIFGVDPSSLPDTFATKTLSKSLTSDDIKLLQKAASVAYYFIQLC